MQALVRRDHLATDPGSQAVEDAACLVFIETQLADVATKLEHDHLIDVIRKTAKKMSPAALAAWRRSRSARPSNRSSPPPSLTTRAVTSLPVVRVGPLMARERRC